MNYRVKQIIKAPKHLLGVFGQSHRGNSPRIIYPELELVLFFAWVKRKVDNDEWEDLVVPMSADPGSAEWFPAVVERHGIPAVTIRPTLDDLVTMNQDFRPKKEDDVYATHEQLLEDEWIVSLMWKHGKLTPAERCYYENLPDEKRTEQEQRR